MEAAKTSAEERFHTPTRWHWQMTRVWIICLFQISVFFWIWLYTLDIVSTKLYFMSSFLHCLDLKWDPPPKCVNWIRESTRGNKKNREILEVGDILWNCMEIVNHPHFSAEMNWFSAMGLTPVTVVWYKKNPPDWKAARLSMEERLSEKNEATMTCGNACAVFSKMYRG